MGRGVRFIINGGVATGVHFIGLWLLAEPLGLRPIGLANFIAAAAGVASSYVGNHWLVFRSTRRHQQTLSRFLLVYGTMTALHGLLMYAWADVFTLPTTLGFVLITGLTAVLNYAAGRWWVFDGTSPPPLEPRP